MELYTGDCVAESIVTLLSRINWVRDEFQLQIIFTRELAWPLIVPDHSPT
ncbi:hypothetical protein [Verrucomicrobium spinosum]|nr:hypothetical protein [Verrucomicrobium spinosum]